MPFSFSLFENLRQRLKVYKKAQKLEDMNNAMEFIGVDNEKGEQVESTLHSNPPSYEQEDNQPSIV